jgi:hypothetical protein
MLFYIQEYSQREIAAFLKLRLTAVNNRLHAARKFLKRRMLAVIKDAVKQNALSDTFAEKVGRVMQVRGPVIEAEFAQNDLPEILSELTITDAPRGIKAKVEVAQHGRDGRVRCIATSPIKGLQRGMKITATGKAIATPLNSASIKRAVRLLSPRIKTKGNVELRETGIKVIDLLCPLWKGGARRVRAALKRAKQLTIGNPERVSEGRLAAHRVLIIDQFTDVKGADIEDLFSPEEYLKLYNATFERSLKKVDGKDRVIKRIERAEKHGFDHGRVAAYFLANQTAVIPTLSPETVSRFEATIKALTAALPT